MASPLLDKIETAKIDDLKTYPKNPRWGNVAVLAESLRENGQYRPLIVQSSTNHILGGNHTFLAAESLGWKTIKVAYVDVDDDQAKRIVVVDNRTSDMATYDADILSELLESLPNPDVGTGYTMSDVSAILSSVTEMNKKLFETVVNERPDVIGSVFEGEYEGTLDDRIDGVKETSKKLLGDEFVGHITPPVLSDHDLYIEELLAKFKHLEEVEFTSSNYWGVPDLRRDMLLDKIPDKIDTWSGQLEVTPDDGETAWIWNIHVTAGELPWDRAIMAFYTWDEAFEGYMDGADSIYKTVKIFANGARTMISPDTSFWSDMPRYTHLNALAESHRYTRICQEIGFKAIPRIMFTDVESLRYAMLGLPASPPILALSSQNDTGEKWKTHNWPECLRLCVDDLKPEALLVYAGGRGKSWVEESKLPSDLEIRYVENYSKKMTDRTERSKAHAKARHRQGEAQANLAQAPAASERQEEDQAEEEAYGEGR